MSNSYLDGDFHSGITVTTDSGLRGIIFPKMRYYNTPTLIGPAVGIQPNTEQKQLSFLSNGKLRNHDSNNFFVRQQEVIRKVIKKELSSTFAESVQAMVAESVKPWYVRKDYSKIMEESIDKINQYNNVIQTIVSAFNEEAVVEQDYKVNISTSSIDVSLRGYPSFSEHLNPTWDLGTIKDRIHHLVQHWMQTDWYQESSSFLKYKLKKTLESICQVQ